MEMSIFLKAQFQFWMLEKEMGNMQICGWQEKNKAFLYYFQNIRKNPTGFLRIFLVQFTTRFSVSDAQMS